MSEKPLFGKFQIIECFKKDDSLAVYLADHIYLNKKIILKTLNTRAISDLVVLERFKREARLLAKINHPNIISVYDFGNYEEFFYISFEYFEGQNLRQAFKNNSWTIDDKINILNQIASGLLETHQKKIIHRDLKPENILINANNEVKIADFGLAQVSGDEKLTAAEAIVGTPAYMTPEQIQGLNTDERSDLFSLGILIYELFFGVNPFLGKDAGQTLNNIQTCRINTPPPHHGMPEYIPIIIDALLKKNQSDRPDSVSFIFDFTGKTIDNYSSDRKKIKWFVIPVAFVLVVIGSLYVYQNMNDHEPAREPDTYIGTDSSAVEKAPDSALVIESSPADTPVRQSRLTTNNNIDNKKNTDTLAVKTVIPEPDLFGYLYIKCKPWANVFIDSIFIDTTPIKEPYKIATGEHTLKLVHPEYPEYESVISIAENDTLKININLDSLAGYFICNVFPWGDIYIDEVLKGQTPLNRPIILKPGKHILEVKNPGYEQQKTEIFIEKSDTLRMTLKLRALVKSN